MLYEVITFTKTNLEIFLYQKSFKKFFLKANRDFFIFLQKIGPLVQWIEYKIPVLTMWVRIPQGSLEKVQSARYRVNES